ncbi:CPBP family intramembrane metalloprotease [Paenibacillus sp. GD4]|uniref:CPBP family intramembrane glutamic endopeptidase n=1 Tax=Paenibacillus sp. GD4 TaxID=3068890 RepID=UPI002796606E|nr:CPBP family intramembrane glutamic endopeptidase [Paenibacillus sp. GD4]MDQ1914232.1 CPBP family intramembrane metalloprotease [Paenibacillus sp. GD4]
MKAYLKPAFVLTLLGLIGIIAIIPYQLDLLSETIGNLDGLPVWMAAALGALQQTVMLFALCLIGLRLQLRTGLSFPHIEAWIQKKSQPRFDLTWFFIGIGVSFGGSLLNLMLDKFVFMPNLNLPNPVGKVEWWKALLAMFYGGITEELMLRLFVMNLLIWVLALVFRKSQDHIPSFFYLAGIIGASILFGALHLPAVDQIFGGLTPLLIVRTLVLNGLLGIWFGYVYWKKGLEQAMLSHMAADVFLHVILINVI